MAVRSSSSPLFFVVDGGVFCCWWWWCFCCCCWCLFFCFYLFCFVCFFCQVLFNSYMNIRLKRTPSVSFFPQQLQTLSFCLELVRKKVWWMTGCVFLCGFFYWPTFQKQAFQVAKKEQFSLIIVWVDQTDYCFYDLLTTMRK